MQKLMSYMVSSGRVKKGWFPSCWEWWTRVPPALPPGWMYSFPP